MKSIFKFLYELFLAVITRKTLGSTFKCRYEFIRCDAVTQRTIKKKLHIQSGREESTRSEDD